MNKLTNADFLEKFYNKHPNDGFKPVEEYQGGKVKIKFNCEKHGVFYARPIDILNGQGCPTCGGTKKMTEEEFIKKASFKHKNFFSYENCNFTNVNNKVWVTCPKHGKFQQKANNHLYGANCPHCSKEKFKHEMNNNPQVNKSTKKISTETFIQKCIEKYGNKYDYFAVDYKNARTKVKIICKEHGTFEVTPNHFLMGRGCPYCSGNVRLTTEIFIQRAKQIHGDIYDYSKTDYKSFHKNIIITCKEHGDFIQTPSNHLKGQGCPICSQSKLEEEIGTFLDKNNIEYEREKHFEWLNKKTLDFYLPQCNIAIECQGMQHFKAIDYFGGEENFIVQQQRDKEKRNLCEEKGVKLLYYSNLKLNYPYKVFEDKNELLNEIKK